jgi:chromosome segregation ATPase
MSTINIRKENKGAIDSNKAEYYKMIKEIEKLEINIKKERLLDKANDMDIETENDKYDYLGGKLKKQNNSLNKANNVGNEVINTQAKTMEELVRQRTKLTTANDGLNEVEQNLSLHDQFVGVMNDRELYTKLKLVFVIVVLSIANLIVLRIKLF